MLQCIIDGGGEKWPLSPNLPKGAPSPLRAAYAIGPDRGHLGVILSLPPAVGKRLAQGIDEIEEYDAIVALGGRAVVLVDTGTSKADEALVFECLEG